MDLEWISKKELLQVTGISYGQLYRWKRENLIPDDWFVRQTTTSGQETVFPREKILSRIQDIQGMKGQFSLEELSRRLAPELSGITYRLSKVFEKGFIPPIALRVFRQAPLKEFITFQEMVILTALGKARADGLLYDADLLRVSGCMSKWAGLESAQGKVMHILKSSLNNYVVVSGKEPPLMIDCGFVISGQIDLEQLGVTLKNSMQ